MSATTDLDRARALHQRLDLPEGWKSEIIEGELRLSLRPGPEHADVITMLGVAVGTRMGRGDWAVLSEVEIEHPAMNGLYSPDLVVMRRPYRFVDGERVLDASAMALIVEVTSPSSGDVDRGPKRRAYARCGVPVYLLVDRQNRTVHRYRSPRPDTERYAEVASTAFGKPIHLPAPFDFTIETADFE